MSNFWAGLGGLAHGGAKGLQMLIALREAEAARKQRADEWTNQRDFTTQQNELDRQQQADLARRARIQSGQQFAGQQRQHDIDRFVGSLRGMNVATVDPEGMFNQLSPQQLPAQDAGSIPLAGGGQIPFGDMMSAANERQQGEAAALRPEFMSALEGAAKRGRSSQAATPIGDFPAAYVPQEFNPQTGNASMYNAGLREQDMINGLVDKTMKNVVTTLRGSPEMATLRDLFANPATKQQAMQQIFQRAKAAAASQWGMYQSLNPQLRNTPINDDWVMGIMPELLAPDVATGKGPDVGAGAPPPAAPSDADRLRARLGGKR